MSDTDGHARLRSADFRSVETDDLPRLIFSGGTLLYCHRVRALLAKRNVESGMLYLLVKSAQETVWPLFIVSVVLALLDLGIRSATSDHSTLQVVYSCERWVTRLHALLKHLRLTPGWSFLLLVGIFAAKLLAGRFFTKQQTGKRIDRAYRWISGYHRWIGRAVSTVAFLSVSVRHFAVTDDQRSRQIPVGN